MTSLPPPLRTLPLHSHFGVIVPDIDLRNISLAQFSGIRSLFEQHSVLLFLNQKLTDDDHLKFASMFGPIEDRNAMFRGTAAVPRIGFVSNADGESVYDENDVETLDLKANMLWHTDSIFLPVPALVNVLAAHELPGSGGETELASTRVGWEEMGEEMKSRFRNKVVRHSLKHSRSKVSGMLAKEEKHARREAMEWNAVWKNPVNGKESLYVASHSFGIRGIGDEEAQALIYEAIKFCTREGRVYSHKWKLGDVLVWDERAMLHRGRPWDYKQRRVLKVVVSSAVEADGIGSVKV